MEPTIRVNGRDYPYPPTDLTLGEMCDAEQFFGVNFNDPERSGMRLTAALLWLTIRRHDKTVSVDDVRNLPPELFEQLAGRDVGPPASEPSDESTTSSEDSPADSVGLDSPLNGTGSQDSDTGSLSDPVISQT